MQVTKETELSDYNSIIHSTGKVEGNGTADKMSRPTAIENVQGRRRHVYLRADSGVSTDIKLFNDNQCTLEWRYSPASSR